MIALLICNGSIADYAYIKEQVKEAGFVICCDGGLKHAEELGLTPDVAIGDFDSAPKVLIDKYKSAGVPFLTFQTKKDLTDSELGVNYALERSYEKGISEVVIIGGTGTRLDHTLANVHLLLVLLKNNMPARLLDEHNSVRLTDSRLIISGEKDKVVSFIPLTEEVSGVYTKGLEYALFGDTLTIGQTRSICNVMTGSEAEVKIESGLLLVIEAAD